MNDINEVNKNTKILVMGLDNSGKTCIILSLKEDTNLLSYVSLKPTKELNVNVLEGSDKKFAIWDFGGQEQYRANYLKHFHKYTTGVKKLIYVIDVQNYDRYELALNYLKDIVKCLTKEKVVLEISVFLHKYDRNIINHEEFKDINEKMKDELINKLKDIIPSQYNHKIFTTSIYTVFEKNVVFE